MRSVERLLEKVTGLAPRPGDSHVMIDDPLGITSIQRVGLKQRDDELVLSVWPGELKPQALWLYDGVRAQRLLAVARNAGWNIATTPHLAFRTSSPPERLYLHPTLSTDSYVEQWSGDDRAMIGGVQRDRMPELWPWLHDRGYASAADTQVDIDAFVDRVRMWPVHLRPGLHLTKTWDRAEAEQLDAADDLAPSLRGALNVLLDALDEPLLDVLTDEGSRAPEWSRVPLERIGRSSFSIHTSPEERLARRTEALLVERYAASLKSDRLCRAKVVVETGVLYSISTTRHVTSSSRAKATASRSSIRMAIGQLADYGRFIAPSPDRAVLVPVRPTRDLLALLSAVGIAAIWEEEGVFRDSAGGAFA